MVRGLEQGKLYRSQPLHDHGQCLQKLLGGSLTRIVAASPEEVGHIRPHSGAARRDTLAAAGAPAPPLGLAEGPWGFVPPGRARVRPQVGAGLLATTWSFHVCYSWTQVVSDITGIVRSSALNS